MEIDLLELSFVGHCFQFNHDGSYSVSAAGRSTALVLILNAEENEYYEGTYSFGAGFFVSINNLIGFNHLNN